MFEILVFSAAGLGVATLWGKLALDVLINKKEHNG